MNTPKLPDIEMIPLDGGVIELRDDRHATTWPEQVAPFDLSRFPITQDVYEAIIGSNPSSFPGGSHPVEGVTWWDAIAFCNMCSEVMGLEPCYHIDGEQVSWRSAAGIRLPTDAEWEYACRAGSRQVRHGPIEEVAWFRQNSNGSTRPVGERTPNAWGLHDMLGNVWEWCWDLYDPEEYGSYRIFRGGGWADAERGVLASNRRRSHPSYAIDDLGFRVACSRTR